MTTFSGPPPETEGGIGALTLGGFFAEVVGRHRDREALAWRRAGSPATTRWTYEQLGREGRRIGRALLAAGVGKGTRVGLLMGNRPEWVAAAYGVAMAGGVLVPMNTFYEAPELEHVLAHSDTAVLLLQEGLGRHAYLDTVRTIWGSHPSTRLPFLRQVVCLGTDSWTDLLAGAEAVPEERLRACAASVSPFDDAIVIYTSGSTASPKGVLHGHRAPTLQSWRFVRHLGIEADDRVWSPYPLFWSAGFSMVMGATLAAGGCLVLQERFEAAESLALLEEERITTPFAWPHQVADLEDHPDWARRDLSALRHVESFTGWGRHPSVKVGDVWSPRAAYGLTETFTILSSLPAGTPLEARADSQGPVLPGMHVRIVDPHTGRPQGAGADGGIAVKGTCLMKGYVKVGPEECFDLDGFFHTGDAGFVDEHGLLHWTGRTDDLIKSAGANVSPVEIETVLLEHPGLKAAVAVAVPHSTLGQMVVLAAVAHDGASITEADVQEFLRGRIASYKIPRRVLFFVEADLVQTGNAKIKTAELRSLAVARLAAEAASGQPT
ncbi:MAG TPA: AMP-binding protein [Acidimicrobiales bacterium]